MVQSDGNRFDIRIESSPRTSAKAETIGNKAKACRCAGFMQTRRWSRRHSLKTLQLVQRLKISASVP